MPRTLYNTGSNMSKICNGRKIWEMCANVKAVDKIIKKEVKNKVLWSLN